MAKWEDSKEDRKIDKAGAKKAGMKMAKWENSAADKRADAKGRKKMGKKK